jgi:hypothetical protein
MIEEGSGRKRYCAAGALLEALGLGSGVVKKTVVEESYTFFVAKSLLDKAATEIYVENGGVLSIDPMYIEIYNDLHAQGMWDVLRVYDKAIRGLEDDRTVSERGAGAISSPPRGLYGLPYQDRGPRSPEQNLQGAEGQGEGKESGRD